MTGAPLLLVPTAFEARALVGDRELAEGGAQDVELEGQRCTLALTGVGPVAAAAMAGHWIARCQPTRVALAGLAGTFAEERATVGDLLVARSITCHGIGAGEGEQHEPLPFPQIPAGALGKDAVTSHLWLHAPRLAGPDAAAVTAQPADLLTVTCAAADAREAAWRRARYPDVVAEEMEGFGVALAARLAAVPLVVLRGVSNVAGDRRVRAWNVDEVLGRARQWLARWLAEVSA